MPLISSSVAPSNTGVANGTPSVQVARRAATISSSSSDVEIFRLARRRCRSCSRNLRRSATFASRLQHLADLAGRGPSPPSPGGLRGSGRRSSATARRADSARCRPACRPPCTACPRPARSSRSTPLLPWRPAILSPGCRRRLTATYTLTIFCTPGGSSSPCVSFFFFCSNIASNSTRICASDSLHRLELRAPTPRPRDGCRTSRGARRSSRYSLVTLAPLASFFGPPLAILPMQQLLDPRERVVLDDAQLVVQVLAVALELVVDDLLRALVALDAFAREHLHVDHGAARCPTARAATCPSRRTPSRRRSRAAASLPASAGSRPSA